jgi:hypothetical protein
MVLAGPGAMSQQKRNAVIPVEDGGHFTTRPLDPGF